MLNVTTLSAVQLLSEIIVRNLEFLKKKKKEKERKEKKKEISLLYS